MELWDVLNKQGEKTGKTIVKGEKLRLGEYHLVVHIWIVNSKGDLLIQKRAQDAYPMPGKWAATGGSALKGEKSQSAAIRELYEELGYKTNPKQIKKIARIVRYSSMIDLWVLHKDIDANNLILQVAEVERVKWVSKKQLEEMIKQNAFHNYGKYYYYTLFKSIYSNGEELKHE